MKAFHNDKSIKQKYLERVTEHEKADAIVQNFGYWADGKGCAVGCTIHGSDHKAYESELGIPGWLARLEDTLFEGMSVKKSQSWPREFLQAINIGADLREAKLPFILFILAEDLKNLDACKFDAEKFPKTKCVVDDSRVAIKEMIEAQRSGDKNKIRTARNTAEIAARSAAASAENTAASAAWSAAASASSAESAARSAAWSASSAESAARSAAWSARSAAYDRYADKLLDLLRDCK